MLPTVSRTVEKEYVGSSFPGVYRTILTSLVRVFGEPSEGVE